MRRSSWLFLTLPLLATAIYVLSLLFYPERDVLILWRREFDASLAALLPLFVSVVVYCALAMLLVWRVSDSKPLTQAQRWGLVGLVIVGGLAIQLAVTRVTEPDPLVGIAWRTYAIKSNGYWTVGAVVEDVGKFIGEYTQNAPEYPVHQSRHPPGLSLIFWLGARLFTAVPQLAEPVADWLRPYSCLSDVSTMVPANQMAAGAFGALVEIIVAMLTVIPLYALIRRLGGQRAAVFAVVLYQLTPGFGMWVAQWDRGFALVTAAVLYLTERIVTENRSRYAFMAGLALSASTFASFGSVPIALFAAIYAAIRIWQTQPRADLRRFSFWRSRIIQAGSVVVGVLTVWALAFLLFGLNPITLYDVIFASHLGIEFPYFPFVFWHPWDIITFIGLPLVVLTVVQGWRRALPLAAAFAITLFLMSVLHVARAETGRVWLFFTPLAVGTAALVLAKRERLSQSVVVGALAVQLVTQASVMRVLNDYGITPDKLPQTAIPAQASMIDSRFGADGHIALLAYSLPELRPGDYAKMTLYWQRMSPDPIPVAYKAFIHIAYDESDQQRLAAHDAAPVDWLYPTTCWLPGQIIADEHPLSIPTDAKPGAYPVFVGLYDPAGKVRPPTFASPPTQHMHGSLLLPKPAIVTDR